ncbi:MAG TPA: class I SAM-dependent methyltransferase [Usitatibacter sp.]|nr:class I SAM-dependent methyltransferase [Usitatibacter sp.]
MKKPTDDFLRRQYPELGAGGFTHVDGTIQFYFRINALVQQHSHVLDLGAGRGWWLEDETNEVKRSLRMLKGKVAEVVGIDVDPVVTTNRSLDKAVVGIPGQALPFNSASFDVVIADYVLEHIDDPAQVAAEIRRILRPGGWFCARTPNRWGYVSIGTRIFSNRLHARILRLAQPERKEIDVFPTRFRLNTMRSIKKYFSNVDFEHFSFYYQAEPAYHFNSPLIFSFMRFVDDLLPRPLRGNLFIFLRRK